MASLQFSIHDVCISNVCKLTKQKIRPALQHLCLITKILPVFMLNFHSMMFVYIIIMHIHQYVPNKRDCQPLLEVCLIFLGYACMLSVHVDPGPPTIETVFKNINITEGENITLRCSFHVPTTFVAKVYWFHFRPNVTIPRDNNGTILWDDIPPVTVSTVVQFCNWLPSNENFS